MGFEEKVDKICGGESSFRELSYFDTALSLFLTIATSSLNILILLGLWKRKNLLNRNFYIVIANIAIADMLSGLIVSPLSTSFHLKEALGPDVVEIKPAEQSSMTYLFFLTNGVSILSMAVLSIDRLGVLLNPFYYYAHMKKVVMMIVLLTTWVIMLILPVLYLKVGYIRFLMVFTVTTVILTMVVMATTMILFRRRIKASDKELKASTPEPAGTDRSRLRMESTTFTPVDRRITKTFMVMLVLFFFNYLPCVVMIIYMNACTDCDCSFIHVMRDIVFLSILSSSFCRAINFIVRLEALRDAVKSVLSWKQSDSYNIPLADRM